MSAAAGTGMSKKNDLSIPGFVTFQEYYQFYSDNKSKIHMKESDGAGQHPVSKEAVARWLQRIERLQNEEERTFYLFYAKAFASILEKSYIPYPVFFNQIQRIANEILRKIESETYTHIVFVLSGELEKSNIWISLLCMDVWDKSPSFFQFANKIRVISLKSKESVTLNHLNIPENKTLFLHFDDMSYSGGQAADAIHSFWNPHSIKPTDTNVDYYVTMPYVTEVAKAYILEYNPGVRFLDSTVMVPNFLQQVEGYLNSLPSDEKEQNAHHFQQLKDMCHEYYFTVSGNPRNRVSSDILNIERVRKLTRKQIKSSRATRPPSSFEKGVWAFRCSAFKTLIYFDHKLADDYSTFQKILYFGSYPINNNKNTPPCEHESLIQGCSIHPDLLQYMNTTEKNACRNYIQYDSKVGNISQDYICPKTFYKHIQYTLCTRVVLKMKDFESTFVKEPIVFSLDKTLYENFEDFNRYIDQSVYYLHQNLKNYRSRKGKIEKYRQTCLFALPKKLEESYKTVHVILPSRSPMTGIEGGDTWSPYQTVPFLLPTQPTAKGGMKKKRFTLRKGKKLR